MKVTLFESMSVNGMMGRPDGRGDFFTEHCWHGFVREARQAGAMIWGRATHDRARGWKGGMAQLAGIRAVVLTGQPDYDPGPGFRSAPSPKDALAALELDGAPEVLVVGGQTVNTAFLRGRLLDEIVLFVESVVVGHGMPLFAPCDVDQPLELLDARRETEFVLRLHYRVRR